MILTFALTLALSLPGRAQTPPEEAALTYQLTLTYQQRFPEGDTTQ